MRKQRNPRLHQSLLRKMILPDAVKVPLSLATELSQLYPTFGSRTAEDLWHLFGGKRTDWIPLEE